MFDALLGLNPSYIWRSLREALTLVNFGARWRVGSSVDVKIWNDPWLLDASDPYIQTPIITRLEDTKVSSLKVMVEPRRNEDRLKELFTDRDVGRIKSVPLSAREEKD